MSFSRYDGAPSKTPWSIKRTGSDIAIVDCEGKVVLKKVVSSLSIPQYQKLSANFDFIVAACNVAAQ